MYMRYYDIVLSSHMRYLSGPFVKGHVHRYPFHSIKLFRRLGCMVVTKKNKKNLTRIDSRHHPKPPVSSSTDARKHVK